MSVSVEKVLNPGLSFLNSSKNEVMPITIGSAGTTTYVYEPISTNQSTTVWNFKQPYGNAVAKKQWFVKMVVQVQTPNVAGATFGKNFCPRAFAPMAGCRFAELKWNGKTSSFNPSEYLDPLTRFYLTDEQREQFMSLCPCIPDKGEFLNNLAYTVESQRARNAANTGDADARVFISMPNAESPFADESVNQWARSCSCFYTQVVAGNLTTRTYTFYCPVMVPPLSFDDSSSSMSFDNINLRLDWENGSGFGDANRLLSTMFNVGDGGAGMAYSKNVRPNLIAGNAVATGASITILGSPQLLVQYVDSIVDIPKEIAYHTMELISDIKEVDGANHNQGTAPDFSVMSTALQPDKIANEILIYLRPRHSAITMDKANVYAGITNLKVRWFGVDYTFGADEIPFLYRATRNNGCTIPYHAFVHSNATQAIKTGAVVCLKPGKDLPLKSGQYPGSPIKHQLQVNVSGRSLHNFASAYDLYVVQIVHGQYIVKGANDVDVQIGLSDEAQAKLVSAPISENVKSDEPNGLEAHGGALNWRKVRRTVREVGKIVSDNKDLLRNAMEMNKDAVSSARSGGLIIGGGVASRY